MSLQYVQDPQEGAFQLSANLRHETSRLLSGIIAQPSSQILITYILHSENLI